MAYSPIGADENGNLPPAVRTKLEQTYAPLWTKDTAYAAGALAVLPAPTNAIGTRIANGTSRTTYDATEQAAWALPVSGYDGGVDY